MLSTHLLRVLHISPPDSYFMLRPSHSPSFFVGPNIVLGNLLSNNCNLFSSHVGLTSGWALPIPCNLLYLAVGMERSKADEMGEQSHFSVLWWSMCRAEEARHFLFKTNHTRRFLVKASINLFEGNQ
jgi:hypothetical protein